VPWVNDCNDNALSRNYLAQEGCTGVDDDCDGLIDDADPSRVGGLTWYLDADGDGLGDPTIPVLACVAPTGFVEGLDCDDTSAQEPHAVFVDADLDGYGSSEALPKECGPPAAGTSLDDQDCDDEDASVTTPVPRYVDADGDGFGGASAPDACPNDAPGTVALAGDCDDSRSDVNPDSAEVCDGVDQDCDGDIDDGVGWTTYADEDGDGFGTGEPMVQCDLTGRSLNAEDCRDDDQHHRRVPHPARHGADRLLLLASDPRALARPVVGAAPAPALAQRLDQPRRPGGVARIDMNDRVRERRHTAGVVVPEQYRPHPNPAPVLAVLDLANHLGMGATQAIGHDQDVGQVELALVEELQRAEQRPVEVRAAVEA
jgi:hypothetical protein